MNRNFWVKENSKHFLVLGDIENGKNLKWMFKTFDRELNPLKDTILVLDRSYTVKNIISDDKFFNLFYKKNYSNEKDYLYVKYDYVSNTFNSYEIKLPLSLTIKKILLYSENLILLSNLKNGRNLVSIYNINTKQLNNIYDFLYSENDIINIFKSDPSSFDVLLSKNGDNNLKTIERKKYSINRDFIGSYTIESSKNSIIESKKIRHNKEEYNVSLLGIKNSKQALGFRIDLSGERLEILNEKKFLEIKVLKDFFIGENKILNKKIDKKDLNNLKLGYEFYIDTLFISNNQIHISFESLKPNYSNDGFSNYSYMPYYNSYTGRYDKKINPKFGGYSHDISIYLVLDMKGNIQLSSVERINNLKTFDNKPYLNYIIKGNNLISFYVNKGIITLLKKDIVKNIKSKVGVFKLKVDENETVIKSETNPEGTFNWYKNNYLSYGIQNIKIKDQTQNINKRVFYISNFEIN